MGIFRNLGFWRSMWALVLIAGAVWVMVTWPFAHELDIVIFGLGMVLVQIVLKVPRLGWAVFKPTSHHLTVLVGDVFGLPVIAALVVYMRSLVELMGHGWIGKAWVPVGAYVVGLIISILLERDAMKPTSRWQGRAIFDWDTERRASKIFHTVFMLPIFVAIIVTGLVALSIVLMDDWQFGLKLILLLVIPTAIWLWSMGRDGSLSPDEHKRRA